MCYVLFYGSFKKYSKRGYNFNRFAQYGEQIYIRDVKLKGYEMYDLGAYPAVCEGEGRIKAELHAVTNKAFNYIEAMELGAGYSPKTIKLNIDFDDEDAVIFLYPKRLPNGINKVVSGDWN